MEAANSSISTIYEPEEALDLVIQGATALMNHRNPFEDGSRLTAGRLANPRDGDTAPRNGKTMQAVFAKVGCRGSQEAGADFVGVGTGGKIQKKDGWTLMWQSPPRHDGCGRPSGESAGPRGLMPNPNRDRHHGCGPASQAKAEGSVHWRSRTLSTVLPARPLSGGETVDNYDALLDVVIPKPAAAKGQYIQRCTRPVPWARCHQLGSPVSCALAGVVEIPTTP